MTPSNPTNSQPLIYRIADKLGVFHLVAPVDHTHTYAEVPGLQDELNEVWAGLNEKANQEDVTEALAGKQNVLTFDSAPTAGSTNPVTSGGVKAALDAKQNALTFDSAPTEGSYNPVTSGGVKNALDNKATYYAIESREYPEDGYSQVTADNDAELGGNIVITVRKGNEQTKTLHIHSDNIENLERALTTPDTTPTANSTNLVTSGGVKAALDGKAPAGDTAVIFNEGENLFVYLPDYFNNGERQRSFILNYQGEATELIDLFNVDTYDTINILSHDSSTIMVGQCYIAVRVIKQQGIGAQGDTYYVIFDGKAEY